MEVKCKVCKRHPEEIAEYVSMAKLENTTPEEYVIQEEGTYNHETGEFFCTDCYIKLGCPNGTA